MVKDFCRLEKKLGVKFNNQDLLRQALVHRSYLNENPDCGLEHNERMEFLGDAVLELVTTEYLFKNYPNPEGELTGYRSALVNSHMLSEIAVELGINDFLLLSRGEARDTGKARECILANAMEAIIGAMYLDAEYKVSADFITRHVLKELPRVLEDKLYVDAKSAFQEQAQDRVGVTPVYEVLKEWGPDHAKQFEIGVFLDKEMVATGQGLSKQEAQQEAARRALEVKKW